MPEYGLYEQGFPGMTARGFVKDAVPGAARQAIAFGAPVFAKEGDEVGRFPFIADQMTFTYSADFSASNSIAVTANGVSITPVEYGTSHAATFAALVAAIEALAGVDVVASNATTRTITLRTWSGSTATPVVTGATSAVTGGSAVTVAAQFGTSLKLRGVAMHQHKEPLNGLVRYEVKDPVSVMISGRIFVKNADTVVAHKPAYLTATGTWTDETVAGAVSNLSTPYFFRSNVSGAGLALLEVVEKPAN